MSADRSGESATTLDTCIDRVVDAVGREDTDAAHLAMGHLSQHPYEAVITAVGMRIFAAADARHGQPLEPTAYLPDPVEGARLVLALRAEDITRVRALANDDAATLVTLMVCTLAALLS